MRKKRQIETDPTGETASASAVSPALRRHFNILFFLIIATWSVLVVLLIPNISAAYKRLLRLDDAREAKKVYPCEPGPWGELFYSRIIVETPENFISETDITPHEIKWFFKGYNKASLTEFIAEAKLAVKQKKVLLNNTKWEITDNGIYVYPSRALIVALSSEARTKLYQELSRFPENPHHFSPYMYRAEKVNEWLRDSDLSSKTKRLVQNLLYDRGSMKAFADSDLVLKDLSTTAQRETLIKALTRSSSLFLKLHISPDTDIDALANYWMKGGKSKDIRPFLRSLAKVKDGSDVDLVHLLPPVPRMLIYTHVTPEMDSSANGAARNHWTSANFFNTTPDDHFLDVDTFVSHLNKDYYAVTGKPAFGDIILFLTPQGKPIHSCNYIADNIVLTKNGKGMTTPWVFMTMDEIEELFSHRQFNVLTLRRKQT